MFGGLFNTNNDKSDKEEKMATEEKPKKEVKIVEGKVPQRKKEKK